MYKFPFFREDQKNIYTQTANLNSAYEASATTTVDLINDVAMAHARLSDNSQSSYTANRNSFESHHIYDYVDETARSAATMAIPEIVFTMTDSDSTSDNKKKRSSSKNQFRNSKSKFSLRKRSRRMSKNKKIKKVSPSSSVDMDYDTVLARFKRQMLENRRRSSIESLKRVGKVSAMVDMFERHAQYVSTSSLVRWQSEPRLPSTSHAERHGLKRQNSYVEPIHAISTTDLSSTTYASSSDEKPHGHRPKHIPMRIRNEFLADKTSEGTDSDSSKHGAYLEVIRTPRPSSLETVASIATNQQFYANELQPPPLVMSGRSNLPSATR